MDSVEFPQILLFIPWMLIGLLPYVLGIWAVAMLVQISRANREIAARLAAIENAMRQK